MGVYDMLPKGSQIKCWECNMKVKNIGDRVPSLYLEYIVLLREGGFVRVKDGIIKEIVEDHKPRYPEDFPGIPCIDKWGKLVPNKDSLPKGMFESQYYEEEK